MNDDVVTKYALQNETPTDTILNNINTVLETRALARLAGHKFIVEAVQSFRNKYPDWKLSLTELLNELGSKYKSKKTVKAKKVVKTHIVNKNNETVTKNFNNTQLEFESETENDDCDTESDKYDFSLDASQSDYVSNKPTSKTLLQGNNEISGENNEISEENIESSEENVESSEDNIESSEENKNSELKSIISSKLIVSKEKRKNLSKPDSIKDTSAVPVLQVPKLLEPQTEDQNLNSSTNKSFNHLGLELDRKQIKRKAERTPNVEYKKKRNVLNEVKPVCETVDSFFMTADDKEYMSVYKPPPTVETKIVERPNVDYQKPKKEIFIKGKKVVLGKQNNFGNRRERRQQQIEEPIDTALHPSWEAKRKQKSLAKFEGKKITFDDDD